MQTKQALIAIGGRATRLRAGDVDVPISKSFIKVAGHPLLYWCLLSLHAAGVSDFVLAFDQDEQKDAANSVLDELPVPFTNAEVNFFKDKGHGVHGLPYCIRKEKYLHEQYIFECGHTVSAPRHYRELDAAKEPGNIVFSAFRPHPQNLRHLVRLHEGRIELDTTTDPGDSAFAHPFIVNKQYGRSLRYYRFNIINVINGYAERGQLRYVKTDVPPEFDIEPEMELALRTYEDSLRDINGELDLDWSPKGTSIAP
jgi:hypothetical protein